MIHQTKLDFVHDKNQNIGQASEDGGDTGPSSTKGTGPEAEKGGCRRESRSVARGTSRNGTKHDKWSDSDSNAT